MSLKASHTKVRQLVCFQAPLGLQSIMALCLLLFLLMNVKGDKLNAFDCDEPTNVEYVSHHKCHIPTDSLTKREMVVLQEKRIQTIDGYECSIQLSTLISFCGAFSHTKETGQSTYNIPQIVSKEKCRQMAENGVFESELMSYPIVIGQLNTLNLFTHGSLNFDGTNIHCQGEALQMSNGQINQNMLRTLHYTIWVHKTDLTASNGKIIIPETQAVIADESDDHGYHRDKTYIWDEIDHELCDLLKAVNLKFSTVDMVSFFSDKHKIQFTTGQSFFHEKCKIMILKTDQDGIYLANPDQDLYKVHIIDTQNVDINAHYSSQLLYLNRKLRRHLQQSYDDNTHPACEAIAQTHTASTKWIHGTTFVRNLGDASVVFQCKKTTVAPLENVDQCYERLPVQNIKGNIFYLDQTNRILMDHAPPINCIPSYLPAYRTTTNEIVVYSPKRKLLKTIMFENSTSPEDGTPGLYSTQMVTDWLSKAYIQNFANNLYSYASGKLCPDCFKDTAPSVRLNFLQDQVNKISALSPPNILLGFNVQYVGGICSIIVVVTMIINILYGITAFFIKLCVLQKDDTGILHSIGRALCAEIFLITKSMNDAQQKKDEETN